MQVTCYTGARARYKLHCDNAGGAASDGRLISLVCYLNEAWDEADGGALRLHLPPTVSDREGLQPNARTPFIDIYPQAGTIALFRSDRVLHEVRPPKVPRYAVALWLIVDNPTESGACYF